MGDLQGKIAVITGAAQGLGEALAIRLSDEGAKVIVLDINETAAQETASKLKESKAYKADVSNYAELEEIAGKVIEAYGRIDVLVCNAAILISGAITELDSDKWKKVIDINLCGYYNTVKAFAPYFIEQKSGSIIQINSKSGKKGSFKNSAYAASKFGGIGLTQSLALEFADYQVRVNAICPGNLLDSPLWVNSLFKQYAQNQGCSEEEIRQKYVNQVPLKRGCQYEDVANMMVYLASEKSSYMTGQAINVTGGQEMR